MSSSSPNLTPLKVALVTTELRPGGAERCLANIALGLNRAQFSPEVYSLAPPPPHREQSLVNELQAAGVPVHFVGVKHAWQFFRAVRVLGRLLRTQQPDVVQTFLFHANVVGALAARGTGAKVFAGLRVAQDKSLRTLVERGLKNFIDQYVCVSDDVAQEAISAGGLPPEKMLVIPNGVDAARFENATPANLSPMQSAQRRVLGMIGRLDKQKGQDVLVRAFALVAEKVPEMDVLLVGEGPEEASLSELAEQLNLGDRVNFAGWRADMPGVLAACEFVVIPSRWEGMSNVLLEAMAAGKAVLATDVQGTRQVLGPLGDEQIFAGDSPAELARRILQFYQDSALVTRLGELNRQRVREKFTVEKMVADYARLFRASEEK